MPQPVSPKVKLAAQAIRAVRGACCRDDRQIGCDVCYSRRFQGCVFLAEQVVEALFPSPGDTGGGGGGIKKSKAA